MKYIAKTSFHLSKIKILQKLVLTIFFYKQKSQILRNILRKISTHKPHKPQKDHQFGELMLDWNDKVCIITGACSGIGWSFVQSVMKKGAKCLMADLNFKAGEEKEKELREKYGQDKVIYFRVDVSSQQNFEAAFEKCVQFFGKVDVLINSAGINGETNWESQLQINLLVSICTSEAYIDKFLLQSQLL